MRKKERGLTVFFIAGIMLICTLTAYGDKGDPSSPSGGDNGKNPGAAVTATTQTVSKTQNSVTINAVPAPGNGQTVEYAISTSSAAPGSGWQDGLTFTGLQAGTAYYVFARSKANSAYNAGALKYGSSGDNQCSSLSGGGVYLRDGTFSGIFNMKSGTISNNTAKGRTPFPDDAVRGGGVCSEVNKNGVDTFIMEGGTISNNTAIVTGGSQAYGGGVYTRNLIMKGGTISGNTVTVIVGANSTVYAQSGGVYTSTLNKTGGTIYGNDAASGLKNTVPTGGKGHAVYSNDGWRNVTAGTTMNTATYGFWLNEE